MTDDKKSVDPKKTPFYKYHVAAKARLVPFAGYLMPLQYRSMTEEHLAVRNRVGLFDVSHMGEIELSGKDAGTFIQKMTVNDVSKLTPGDIQYSCMCDTDGGIIDDLLVYCLKDKFMLVVNAANIETDYKWLESHLGANNEDDVVLVDKSAEIGLLAIQGPRAIEVVSALSDFDFDAMSYYHSARIEIAGLSVLISRTGYTGEDGFEIYMSYEDADDIWQVVFGAGEKVGMELVGLGARDTLRIEMKMALYGNDIDRTTTPIEGSMSWVVNFESGDFIGREALKKQKEEKPAQRLVCLELESRAFPRKGYEIYSEGQKVGRVTSGTFSPSLKKPIALGYLDLSKTKIGSMVEIQIRDKAIPAKVVKPPFYKEGTHK